MTRRTRWLATLLAVLVVLAAAGCTDEPAAGGQVGDVGGGVPGQVGGQDVVTTTTLPGSDNPNIDKWFGPEGLNPELFTYDEVACMKDELAVDADMADSVDVARASRTQWAENGRRVQLACTTKERMGYLFIDDVAAGNNADPFPQPMRECFAKSFAELTDEQIITINQATLAIVDKKVQARCPDLVGTATSTR